MKRATQKFTDFDCFSLMHANMTSILCQNSKWETELLLPYTIIGIAEKVVKVQDGSGKSKSNQ